MRKQDPTSPNSPAIADKRPPARLGFTLGALVGLAALLPTGCRLHPPPPPAPTLSQVFHLDKLEAMDAAVEAAIADGGCPGGVLWLERQGVSYTKAYGRRAVLPQPEPMTLDTIFDAASLTKVVATTPAVMRLLEQGRLELDAPAARYLPEFRDDGREAITVRHLLTHTSGLRAGIALREEGASYDRGITLACDEKPQTTPGTAFRYSDVNFILLGEIVRRVGGVSLAEFAAREIFRPLRMTDTGFLPSVQLRDRIAPTERKDDRILRGVVHDPTARRMGGVAGHAGLFTTAADLARFARMMLGDGTLEGTRLFEPESVARMTRVGTPPGVSTRRGLGWDIDSGYAGPRGEHFPVGSYGHTGWTGGSLWIDPFSGTFIVFLSNRNHPTEDGSVTALRRRLGTLAAEAIRQYNFLHVPGALAPGTAATASLPDRGSREIGQVLNGIDVLVRERFAPLEGRRVGLVTNHTGHDRSRNPTIDLLRNATNVQLKALFSPEHGIRGLADAGVADSVDEPTGLPIYSLYGENRKPRPQQLEGLDALVFDLQDIGCRFYTYISTLGLCLEAAAEAKIEFFVLDRVNPINGSALEGPVYAGDSRFIAFHSLPLRHGMTVGELARMFNAERRIGADLTVMPLEGWKRGWWFDQTSLPWTNPSPNMRTLKAAILYPGVGLLESAVSVGRGTDTPFEVVGAPYIDDGRWAAALNRAGLPGVRFVPIRFTPAASVFKGQPCGGVYLVLTDADALNAVDLGLTLALTLQAAYPNQFALDKIQTLLLDAGILDAIRSGKSLAEIRQLWAADLKAFAQRRAKFLLYR